MIGKKVIHKSFGDGIIISQDNDSITVKFEESIVKSFIYPDIFYTKLDFANPDDFSEMRKIAENNKSEIQKLVGAYTNRLNKILYQIEVQKLFDKFGASLKKTLSEYGIYDQYIFVKKVFSRFDLKELSSRDFIIEHVEMLDLYKEIEINASTAEVLLLFSKYVAEIDGLNKELPALDIVYKHALKLSENAKTQAAKMKLEELFSSLLLQIGCEDIETLKKYPEIIKCDKFLWKSYKNADAVHKFIIEAYQNGIEDLLEADSKKAFKLLKNLPIASGLYLGLDLYNSAYWIDWQALTLGDFYSDGIGVKQDCFSALISYLNYRKNHIDQASDKDDNGNRFYNLFNKVSQMPDCTVKYLCLYRMYSEGLGCELSLEKGREYQEKLQGRKLNQRYIDLFEETNHILDLPEALVSGNTIE